MPELAAARRKAFGLGPWALLAPLLLGAAACPKKRTAYTDCRNLEKYESNFGVLNSPQFDLGAVIDLNNQTMQGGRIRTVVLHDGDTKQTDPISSSEILSNTDFKIQANADIPVAVKAAVETYLNNNTLLSLVNYRRKDIIDPAAALTADAPSRTDIVPRLQNPNGHVYLMVASLVLADSLDFSLRSGAGVDAKANVIKSGNYELKIDYSCAGTLKLRAKQGPLLFKAVQLALGANGQIQAVASTVDLKNYNLNLGIQ